jgi:hypothetical protein
VVAPWQSELVVFLQCRRTAGYDSPVVSIILLKNGRVPNESIGYYYNTTLEKPIVLILDGRSPNYGSTKIYKSSTLSILSPVAVFVCFVIIQQKITRRLWKWADLESNLAKK